MEAPSAVKGPPPYRRSGRTVPGTRGARRLARCDGEPAGSGRAWRVAVHTIHALAALLVLCACEDGGRAGDQPDAPVAAPDAAVAAPDAPPAAIRYDIAYVDEMTLDPTPNAVGFKAFAVVVNTGDVPIDLSTLAIAGTSDDSAAIAWTVTTRSDAGDAIAPGRSSGCLSPLAVEAILTSGLVTEPGAGCADFDEGLQFEMAFSTLAPATSLRAEAVVTIDGVAVRLPFTFHINPGTEVIGTVFDGARRIASDGP